MHLYTVSGLNRDEYELKSKLDDILRDDPEELRGITDVFQYIDDSGFQQSLLDKQDEQNKKVR